MDVKDIIKEMTLEEKSLFLTGSTSMETANIERLDIPVRRFADGPHGIRFSDRTSNATMFPALCCLGATWDENTAKLVGEGIGNDCVHHSINMILGPGVNIKKNILCGRNFEYISEDPVLTGELAAAYVNGVESKGVATSVKHFAANNQELYRETVSAEIDERTLREIYLKAFEIVVKKSNPASIMCAYNKVNSIWCSENAFLLTEVLRNEWGYKGFVVSDWGAVHDVCRAISAGLDLEMPCNQNIVKQITSGIKQGKIDIEHIDRAIERVLEFVMNSNLEETHYDRQSQHMIAEKVAEQGITLLKNDENTLPVTADKYKTIAVIGELATAPNVNGQGSAEVYPEKEYIDSPLKKMREEMPEITFKHLALFEKYAIPNTMIWSKTSEFCNFIEDSELVIFFLGTMLVEETEMFDRSTAKLNPHYKKFIDLALEQKKKVAVVLQTGSAVILDDWADKIDSLIEMWLGGEAAGGAIAKVLSGKINPSGKLPETFPKVARKDFEYPGNGLRVDYNEKLNVGYRYYDQFPDEIRYPFGHGLSYTSFEYKKCKVVLENDIINISVTVKNTGKYDGAEVVQVYVGDKEATVKRPVKELKAFKKVFIKSGETKTVNFEIPVSDISYYNTMLHDWVVENGEYTVYIGSSSQDIRIKSEFLYEGEMPYSMQKIKNSMIG